MFRVYLNGSFLPLEQATVSALDRGFTFADGVYEVVPVFSGRLFRLTEHLKRLQDSLTAISLPLDYDEDKWRLLTEKLLLENNITGDCSVYIQITRGTGERNHYYPGSFTPTVFMMCKPLPDIDVSQGISAILHEDIRWKYCRIKSVALLPNVLLKQYAREKDGSVEAILVRDGYITEGAASNVFMARDNTVITPPKSDQLLPGITRDLVVELLRDTNYPCLEIPLPETQLISADEIWITSATMGLAPVTRLNGHPVNNSHPGPIWQQLNAMYRLIKG